MLSLLEAGKLAAACNAKTCLEAPAPLLLSMSPPSIFKARRGTAREFQVPNQRGPEDPRVDKGPAGEPVKRPCWGACSCLQLRPGYQLIRARGVPSVRMFLRTYHHQSSNATPPSDPRQAQNSETWGRIRATQGKRDGWVASSRTHSAAAFPSRESPSDDVFVQEETKTLFLLRRQICSLRVRAPSTFICKVNGSASTRSAIATRDMAVTATCRSGTLLPLTRTPALTTVWTPPSFCSTRFHAGAGAAPPYVYGWQDEVDPQWYSCVPPEWDSTACQSLTFSPALQCPHGWTIDASKTVLGGDRSSVTFGTCCMR